MISGYSYEEILDQNVKELSNPTLAEIATYLNTPEIAILCKIDGKDINERLPYFHSRSSSDKEVQYGYLNAEHKVYAVEIRDSSSQTFKYYISNKDYISIVESSNQENTESTSTTVPRKWSKVIKAWADGQKIQYRAINGTIWVDINPTHYPFFDSTVLEFRIKPVIVTVKKLVYVDANNKLQVTDSPTPNLVLKFDSKTNKLIESKIL